MKIIYNYWTQIVFLMTVIGSFGAFILITIESVKCSLRNDILQIYEMCKKERRISAYQYEAILKSAELYFKLKGNSFVKNIVDKIKEWDVID